MSATSIRYVTSIPAGGLKFEGSPLVEINTITPLGVGDLVIKPSTPLEGRLTETIPIDASLVGASIPGASALLIDETTTSLPLIVVLAAVGAMPHHVMVAGASAGGGGGAGAATEAKQDAQIVQAATLISNTTGLALDATIVLVKEAIDALKGNGVLDATLYDILIELQTRGALDSASLSNIEAATSDSAIKLDSILSSSQTLETYTDGLEGALAAINTKLANPLTVTDNGTPLFVDIANVTMTALPVQDKAHQTPLGGTWLQQNPSAVAASSPHSGSIVSVSSGYLRSLRTVYTGALASGLFLQLHDATALTGLSSGTMLKMGVEINTGRKDISFDIPELLYFTNGLIAAFSTTQATYTATVQTGFTEASYSA